MATTSTNPTTALDAINIMLGTIGQSPVSSLNTPGLVDAVTAKSILSEITREVQDEGWNFNTDTEYELAPDTNGFINPGSNVLRIDTSRVSRHYNVVRRGVKLWDKTNKTFVFTEALKFDITWLFDYEEMPETARRYVAIRASRIFQDRTLGSDTIHVYSNDDETRARASLERNENLTSNPSIFDDPDMAQIINRDSY